MAERAEHVFEPAFRMGTPRSARIEPAAQAELRNIIVIGLIVTLIITLFAARDLGDLHALLRRGKVLPSIITGKRAQHGKSTTYYLSYSLSERGISINDEDDISSDLYDKTQKGEFLPLTFLPDQPQTHRLGRVNKAWVRKSDFSWGMGILFGAGMFGLLIAGILYEYRRELWLARYGIPVAALITGCTAPAPAAKTSDYTVSYRCAISGGEEAKTCTVSKEVGSQLATGQTVTALYDPENPSFIRLYRALRYTEIT